MKRIVKTLLYLAIVDFTNIGNLESEVRFLALDPLQDFLNSIFQFMDFSFLDLLFQA